MNDSRSVMSATMPSLLLRGAGQVMFQNNVWTGLFFLLGIFWGGYLEGMGAVAWGALLGLVVSTLTGYMLGLPEEEGLQGLWGFNGILVGCAFPAFLGTTLWMWLALIFCAAMTTWVRVGFERIASGWRVGSYTFPFVFCTWIFLLAARALHGLPPTHLADPILPAACSPIGSFGIADWVIWWFKGVAQVFLIDSWVTGLLFLIGLLLSDWRAALWAAVGSAVGLSAALMLGASGSRVAAGLYGFSPVLTAIALGTVFCRPGVRASLGALAGIVATLFVQAAMDVLLEPVGIPTLTAPFCVATWLFLLPSIHLGGHPEDRAADSGSSDR